MGACASDSFYMYNDSDVCMMVVMMTNESINHNHCRLEPWIIHAVAIAIATTCFE